MAYILGLLLMGLVVGALGRLLIPGPNPMGVMMTIGVGILGSLLGGAAGQVLFGHYGGGLLLAVVGAGLIVWFLERFRASGSPQERGY